MIFSLLWIISLPRRVIGLSPPLLRIAWLRRLVPDFAGRIILWCARWQDGLAGGWRAMWARMASGRE